eukprot:m.21337 g.21337  ORF g.21337 m.21337 type:complete len:531 (-) comp11128_c0_seq1:91-1683(-)
MVYRPASKRNRASSEGTQAIPSSSPPARRRHSQTASPIQPPAQPPLMLGLLHDDDLSDLDGSLPLNLAYDDVVDVFDSFDLTPSSTNALGVEAAVEQLPSLVSQLEHINVEHIAADIGLPHLPVTSQASPQLSPLADVQIPSPDLSAPLASTVTVNNGSESGSEQVAEVADVDVPLRTAAGQIAVPASVFRHTSPLLQDHGSSSVKTPFDQSVSTPPHALDAPSLSHPHSLPLSQPPSNHFPRSKPSSYHVHLSPSRPPPLAHHQSTPSNPYQPSTPAHSGTQRPQLHVHPLTRTPGSLTRDLAPGALPLQAAVQHTQSALAAQLYHPSSASSRPTRLLSHPPANVRSLRLSASVECTNRPQQHVRRRARPQRQRGQSLDAAELQGGNTSTTGVWRSLASSSQAESNRRISATSSLHASVYNVSQRRSKPSSSSSPSGQAAVPSTPIMVWQPSSQTKFRPRGLTARQLQEHNAQFATSHADNEGDDDSKLTVESPSTNVMSWSQVKLRIYHWNRSSQASLRDDDHPQDKA